MDIDLDIAQVRAFVGVCDELHFGRAASRLFVTQQALSKRIQRLELTVGEQLLVRDAGGVRLTDAGQRLLPHARQLLAAAGAAVAAARVDARPLRVDVWGQVQDPLRRLRGIIDRTPELVVELSMRRSVVAAMEALRQGQIDAAFGRVHDLTQPWPDELAQRLVLLEPLAVAVGEDHPLAGSERLVPADLRPWTLWGPRHSSSAELSGFWTHFADDFDLEVDTGGSNLGLDEAVQHLRRHPTHFLLLGANWTIPGDVGIRRIPLDPTPCYPFSLIWRAADRHPTLTLLRRLLTEAGAADGWLRFDPQRHWLPDADLADLADLGDATADAAGG
jgi:DNA-binding transcriptional LysR family regulator